jgi:tripartite-type tricarboxylate transporter receptor subunit TctC
VHVFEFFTETGMKAFLVATSLVLGAVHPLPGLAQYPNKPVHLVVPFAAGGPSDAAARTLAQGLSQPMGQPVLVENKPGANGLVAAQAVTGSPGDGYTLLWVTGSMIGLPLLQKNPTLDWTAGFAPIAIVGRLSFGIYVHPSVPAKSIAEFVAYARANPDKLSYGTSTLSEFQSTVQLMKATGVSMVRVPYKGIANAMPDLIAGRVQVYFGPMSTGLPQVKDGKLRMLAAAVPHRSAAAPEVPTLAELGYPGISAPVWQAVFAPAHTPRDIVERVSREIGKAVQTAEVRAQYDRQLLQIGASTPEVLGATVRTELLAWEQFIRENDIPKE